MDSLTPSDLFSPSKARQQRAQAQDWAHIDSWLSYKYSGRSVPTFERNEETLKALRELSMANERADEERAVMERVEREALKELDEVQHSESTTSLLSHLTSSLTPEGSQALSALSSTAVSLNTHASDHETIAHALIQHTITSQNLHTQLVHIDTLQAYLLKQQSLIRTQFNTLQSDTAFTPPPNLQRQTAEAARQTKHLRTKIREYEDKLSSLQSTQSRTMTPASKAIGSAEAIAEMLEQTRVLDEMRGRVEALEREVGDFAGLPAEREAARKEVNALEVRLDLERRQRDELFEGMVEKK